MKYRKFLLICSALALCGAGAASPGRAQDKGDWFEAGMSLDATVAWLGRQLTHVRSIPTSSVQGKYNRRVETRLVKAKGCTLSYSTSSEYDTHARETASASSQRRELWTIDLAGLDPASVIVLRDEAGRKRVFFTMAHDSRNAIRSTVFENERLTAVRGNVFHASFYVRDEEMTEQASAALTHAVELCREKKH